jgi:hypothetical protein
MAAEDDHREPVEVAHFNTVEEAHMAAARLNAEGIEAMVEPYRSTDMLSRAADPDGTAVMVAADQAEAAQAVLEKIRHMGPGTE